MPFVPLLGMAACLYLMVGLPELTWTRFIVWTIIGIAVYLGYGMRHSKLAAQNSQSYPLKTE
jgi:APA family basic amino acid/polyamine antiporter